MAHDKTFTLSVNYWPRKTAMYWWKDFERAEVESEFAQIDALKLQVVRLILLWEDFILWDKLPYDSHEHERFFGLTRYDGTATPAGAAMRQFAERVAAGELPLRMAGPLQLDPNVWYMNPSGNFERIFHEWRGRL